MISTVAYLLVPSLGVVPQMAYACTPEPQHPAIMFTSDVTLTRSGLGVEPGSSAPEQEGMVSYGLLLAVCGVLAVRRRVTERDPGTREQLLHLDTGPET